MSPSGPRRSRNSGADLGRELEVQDRVDRAPGSPTPRTPAPRPASGRRSPGWRAPFAAMPDDRQREARVPAVLPEDEEQQARRRGRAAASAAPRRAGRPKPSAASMANRNDDRDEQERQEAQPDGRQVLDPAAQEQAERRARGRYRRSASGDCGARGGPRAQRGSAGAAAGPVGRVGRRAARAPRIAGSAGRRGCRRRVCGWRAGRSSGSGRGCVVRPGSSTPSTQCVWTKASTILGSNWMPANLRSSAIACSAVSGVIRYGRAAVIASNESATCRTRASSGISSPIRRSG